MDEKEILARYGVGKKFAYGLFIQSIFVIIAAILAFNTFQWSFFNGFGVIEDIISILTFVNCISVIIYLFYEFNKNTEYFFIISIILFIITKLLWIIDYLLYPTNNFSITIPIILLILEVICAIYFLYAFNKNYNSAKYTIILIVMLEAINVVYCCLSGVWPWYVEIPYLVISISIDLIYFERVQREKYPKLN